MIMGSEDLSDPSRFGVREKGKKYVVDREYRSGGSVVTVLHSGRLFARVRNEAGYERDVMTDRLSEYKGEEEKKND